MSVKQMHRGKRIFIWVMAFLFCIIASASIPIFTFSSIFKKKIDETESEWHKVRVADSSLYSDNGYIDYANEVFLDDVTHPDMKEMGLYWAKWDSASEKVVLVDADSKEGAQLVDPTKPTNIFVHGMLTNGNTWQEVFYLNKSSEDPTEFNITTEHVSLIYLWLLEGWNVGVFHYNRFAAESAPTPIEAKIWAIDGKEGMRIKHADDTYTENVTEYSIAEHFVAEYLRAMNLLPESMGNEEIRISAHSMGGELMTVSIFLLTEVASARQLSYDKLPNRYSMLDPYFCVNIDIDGERIYIGPSDITIRWSGKGLYRNNTGYALLECLKDITANGICVDYYTNRESTLRIAMPEDITSTLKEMCVYVITDPNYSSYNKGYVVMFNGHNGIRDWYYCSIRGDMVKNGDENSLFTVAASAKTPTSIIMAQKGMAFIMSEGARTVHPNDDVFVTLD